MVFEMVQRCRECGCTEDDACMVGGMPCHWAEPDLCSACAYGADRDEEGHQYGEDEDGD